MNALHRIVHERQNGHRIPRVASEVAATDSTTGELLRITRKADGDVTKLNWATYFFARESYAFREWL